MDKQLLVANSSGRSNRPISFVWAVFTRQGQPWKLKSAPCRHCLDEVIYHRKSEYVLAHLKSCLAFHEDCERYLPFNSNVYLFVNLFVLVVPAVLRTNQAELLRFVITSAKVTNNRRRVARLDASQPMLAAPLFEREGIVQV